MSRRKASRPELSIVREGMPVVNPMGVALTIETPDEKVVVKEVPAKVDGVVVGTAQIYDDGTVGVVLDLENAPAEALERLGDITKGVGYSIGDFFEGTVDGAS